MKKNVTIQMETGLEARPIALLVQIANKFESCIYLEVEEKRVNVKSIMGMMSLALINGTKVAVEAEGKDSENALKEIEDFLSGK